MTLRDVPVSEPLGLLSDPLKVHRLILYLVLILRKDLPTIRDPMQNQACHLHYSHGPSANAVGAAPPLRNRPLMTGLGNCDTVDVTTKNLADPSLIRQPYWIDLAILSDGRVYRRNGDVEAKIDKALRVFLSAGAVMLQVEDCGECGKTASEGMEEHATNAWYDKG